MAVTFGILYVWAMYAPANNPTTNDIHLDILFKGTLL
jgi:hypothetical protein